MLPFYPTSITADSSFRGIEQVFLEKVVKSTFKLELGSNSFLFSVSSPILCFIFYWWLWPSFVWR